MWCVAEFAFVCVLLCVLPRLHRPRSRRIVLPELRVVRSFCSFQLCCRVITRLLPLPFCFYLQNASFKYYLSKVSKGKKRTQIHTRLPTLTLSQCVSLIHRQQLTNVHHEGSIISDLPNSHISCLGEISFCLVRRIDAQKCVL